ncbi:MAG: DUF104 domain-containing protein [Chloroflexi bacterium]|nr:DUF104 domain-containing protein [Chloroflexota bacterium]
MLLKTKATYSEGVIKPSTPLDICDGTEVMVTVETDRQLTIEERRAAIGATAGAWKDTVDCDKLLEDIYASRAVVSTRVPKL